MVRYFLVSLCARGWFSRLTERQSSKCHVSGLTLKALAIILHFFQPVINLVRLFCKSADAWLGFIYWLELLCQQHKWQHTYDNMFRKINFENYRERVPKLSL